MASRHQFRGVTRSLEVIPSKRHDDVRTFSRRLGDALDTSSGVLWYFGTIAALTLTVGLYLPFAGELALTLALLSYATKFRYSTRKWSAPFRVPAYLKQWTGRRYRDASTGGKDGEGLFYLGMDLESREEVWATANDLRTHRMVVATTGGGKTEEILGSLFNSLVLDSGFILVDGKADPKTYGLFFRACRVQAREEDLLMLNYIMGGKDFASGLDSRRSNTYNPLSSGSSAMKAELMVSLLDSGSNGGGSDMWQGRAIAFLDAITSPLSYLASQGQLLFNSKLLSDFYLLPNIENLVWFGIFKDQNGKVLNLKDGSEAYRRTYNTLSEKYCGAIKLYLTNLPGYEIPETPHKPVEMDAETFSNFLRQYDRYIIERDKNKGEEDNTKKNTDQTRAKALEQHGFITMQLVRATGNLTFNYGHIYSDEIGEIDYKDVFLNRRVLLVLLPALERSKSSMEQLGKMAATGIKSMLANLLDTPLEGRYRKIIEGRPSNAQIPMPVSLDEYGSYTVPGFVTVPAQGRSYGISLTFAVQDIPSLYRADKNEGEATWENTNLRHLGRMTGGKDSDTFKKFDGAAGQALVQVSKAMSYRKGRLDSFKIDDSSSIEQISRLNIDDLSQQADGEFHLVVGSKSEGLGGARVVRYLAFYTGDTPTPEDLRLVPYVQVKPFSDSERAVIARNEAIATNVSQLSSVQFGEEIQADALYSAIQNDIISQFLAMCEAETVEPSSAVIRNWLDAYDMRAVAKRRENITENVKSDVVKAVENMLRSSVDAKSFSDLHLRAATRVIDSWIKSGYDSGSGGSNEEIRVEAGRKTKTAHSVLVRDAMSAI